MTPRPCSIRRTPSLPESSGIALDAVLERLHSRREFPQLLGQGLGYAALASTLPACGGGSSGGDAVTPAPSEAIPAASAEYTVLKRTSFGVHRDALSTIRALGVDAFLEQQLDYAQIDDSTLEASLQTLFPLTTQSPARLIGGFPDNIADIARQMIGATQYGRCSVAASTTLPADRDILVCIFHQRVSRLSPEEALRDSPTAEHPKRA